MKYFLGENEFAAVPSRPEELSAGLQVTEHTWPSGRQEGWTDDKTCYAQVSQHLHHWFIQF